MRLWRHTSTEFKVTLLIAATSEERCAVCRGEATTSAAECTCRRCTNYGVPAEVDLPTNSNSQSFQEYVARNADNIRRIVRDCQNKHGHSSFTAHLSPSIEC